VNLPELGTFLQARRALIKPSEVGLPTGRRRRVPGLRRDEVATLAAASVDYYTELERGRGAQPSAPMLTALARALRLDHDERDHLFHLAGRAVPDQAGPLGHVQPAMLDLLGRLTGTAAQIITDLHETLVQNPLARALLGPPPTGPGFNGSYAYRWFTDPASRAVYPVDEHPHHSRMFVSDLRAVAGRRSPGDRSHELVATLRRDSREFADLWEAGTVGVRRKDTKRIVHPEVGVIELDCLTLLSDDSRQRLLWFVAHPGTQAVDQLRLLEVLGQQDLTTRQRHH